MVGGHRIPQVNQGAGPGNGGDRPRLGGQAGEKRGLLDVGAGRVPLIKAGGVGGDLPPFGGPFKHLPVSPAKLVGGDAFGDDFPYLTGGGPQVAQVDVGAVGGPSEGVPGQVDVHRARQGVGDHQRRGGQVVGPHQRADPPLEVAVAGQHRRRHQIIFGDGGGDGGRQGAGVADAGGAPVADGVETQGLQVVGQPRLPQVVGHHFGAGGEGGFHPRAAGQSQAPGFAGQKPRPHHHLRVGSVGATGDGRDHHRPIRQFKRAAVQFHSGGPLRGAVSGESVAQVGGPLLFHRRQGDAVLGAAGPGQRRLHPSHVQFVPGGVGDFPGVVPPQPLQLRVAAHGFHQLRGPSGEPQVVQGAVVDGEETAGGPVFGGHVGDGGPVGHRHGIQSRPVELHELAHHPRLPQQFGYAQHQVGGGGPLRQAPGQFHPHHLRRQHVDGAAHHGRFRFDAAHPPAQHPQSVDHGGVGVQADQRIRVKGRSVVPHHFRQVFQVDLVDDAGGGGHHPEVVESRLPPFQELVALPVAFKLFAGVDGQGVGGVVSVHLHRMVDHQVAGGQRVDPAGGLRVAGHAHDGVPHGGQVHQRRYPGEVLQHHPPRRERDFGGGHFGRVVGGEGQNVFFVYRPSVAVAQGRLQQHLDGIGQGVDVPMVAQGVQAVNGPAAEGRIYFPGGAERVVWGVHRIPRFSGCRRSFGRWFPFYFACGGM